VGRVFISHAEADGPLVRAFVDLLQTGLDISRKKIFCSSIEGMKIRPGKSFVEYIKGELTDADYVVMIITPAYYESAFCMCELGATWIQSKDAYPLLVPPIGYDNLKAVLHGVQSGKINDEQALNEFNDRLTELGIASPASGRWESKRDEFLLTLPDILKKLPGRTMVAAAEYQKLKDTYKVTQESLQAEKQKMEGLEEMIEELKKAKDKTEVKKIVRKNVKESEVFEELCQGFMNASKDVPNCVIEAIFQTQDAEFYPGPPVWNNNAEWDDIRTAEKRGMLTLDGSQIRPNTDSPKVRKTLKALDELSTFLSKVSEEFDEEIEEEHEFQCSLSVRDFWEQFLGLV